MAIKEGDKIPDATFMTMTATGPKPMSTKELFAGKKVALFAVPGAFTPTCSAQHLPGFLNNFDALKGKGVDTVACMAVNDAFVMAAWGKDRNVGEKILMLGDGNADFTKKIGLELDASKFGLGGRSKRFSMYVVDGVLKKLNVDEGSFEKTKAEVLLGQI